MSDRKQFIKFNNKNTNLEIIRCGIPQGSLLGPLLFLIFVNDLKKSTKFLDPIMFADATDLFYSNKDINTLFKIANEELNEINEWFRANKLSINAGKTKYIFFHKQQDGKKVPQKLPMLVLNNTTLERVNSIKFLGVVLDENINWNRHIELVENKISKNIDKLYRASVYLDKESLKSIYFAFIHSYISYCNIAWAGTSKTKLNRIFTNQKHAFRIIHNESKYVHSKPLMQKMNALNVYQINIFQILRFIHKHKLNKNPKIFANSFNKIEHKYLTKCSRNNKQPKLKTKNTSFAINYRGPYLWNKCLDDKKKVILPMPLFSSIIKRKLLDAENEISFF